MLTVILCVVAPVLQTLFTAELEVKTTEPPLQKVVVPPAVIAGVEGMAFTDAITAVLEADKHPVVVFLAPA